MLSTCSVTLPCQTAWARMVLSLFSGGGNIHAISDANEILSRVKDNRASRKSTMKEGMSSFGQGDFEKAPWCCDSKPMWKTWEEEN